MPAPMRSQVSKTAGWAPRTLAGRTVLCARLYCRCRRAPAISGSGSNAAEARSSPDASSPLSPRRQIRVVSKEPVRALTAKFTTAKRTPEI